MIAMQYSFALPADYDMDVIRQRIASKGHLLDHFPGLAFKAYLSADRDSALMHSQENLYAPFYLWESSEGMNDFLCGPGFEGLVKSFGWPSVKVWSVWQASLSAEMAGARYASREVIAIPPFAALSELRERESGIAQQDIASQGALAAVTAFEPGSWTLVRLRLWRNANDGLHREQIQRYEVGHMSVPGLQR
ncbi:MAG: DUF4865 family protein [Pseudomonadota bacterium]